MGLEEAYKSTACGHWESNPELSHLTGEQPPAIVLHPAVPCGPVLRDQGQAIVCLPGHGTLMAWEGVVLGAVGAHVHNGSVGEDFIVDAWREPDLKEKHSV